MEFFFYLKKEKKNSHNSAQSLMSSLRGILMPAIKNQIIKLNPFLNVKFVRKKVDRDFLELDEINAIQQLADLTHMQQLCHDIFLIAIFTGLSYSDIVDLNKLFFNLLLLDELSLRTYALA
ncbi:MAG: phage integrase SAM-like domain-containing protein [Bacteroidota bacterium]|nr:phage integrase SAM-like domain-containing protein [Bacteroidota bacterium]